MPPAGALQTRPLASCQTDGRHLLRMTSQPGRASQMVADPAVESGVFWGVGCGMQKPSAGRTEMCAGTEVSLCGARIREKGRADPAVESGGGHKMGMWLLGSDKACPVERRGAISRSRLTGRPRTISARPSEHRGRTDSLAPSRRQSAARPCRRLAENHLRPPL